MPEILYCLRHRAPLLGYEVRKEKSPDTAGCSKSGIPMVIGSKSNLRRIRSWHYRRASKDRP